MRVWTATALACVVAGCLSPGPREAPRYYVLEVAGTPPFEARSPRAAMLVVAPTSAVGFYDNQRIVYSRAPGTRAYYQFNRWIEHPSRTIHGLLIDRLESSGAFNDVATATSGIRGDFLLSVHITELYHDATTAPGSAKVSLTAVLADAARSEILARRPFTRAAPAASYDAPGAVLGFNQAIALVLDDVVAWVDAITPR